MSATTKKKHVTKEVLEEYPLPEGNRQVVKVVASRGNNLHEVETSQGEKFLVTMPTKFRKHIWIKRGDFILVDPVDEGDKVKAEISHILFKDQIKYIQEQNLWPESFSEGKVVPTKGGIPDDLLPPSDSDDEELGDLCINVNRVQLQEYSESESEDSCSQDEEEEEKEATENDRKEDGHDLDEKEDKGTS